MKLCSACLLGFECRWDGKTNKNEKVLELAKNEELVPVCPEEMGGLPTPREPIEGGAKKLFAKDGEAPLKEFRLGAQKVLALAKKLKIKEAILKQGSPSCGSRLIPDGSFSHTKTNGNGVTADLLIKNGIKVISEEDL